jgi:PAS domain-containing protein
MEHRIVRPNGEVRFVRSVSGMIEDETSGRRVVGTTTDITERE